MNSRSQPRGGFPDNATWPGPKLLRSEDEEALSDVLHTLALNGRSHPGVRGKSKLLESFKPSLLNHEISEIDQEIYAELIPHRDWGNAASVIV